MTTEIHITEDPPIVTIVQSGPIGPPGAAGSGGTYTDADAVAAMGAVDDANTLNHDRVTDSEIDARAALQNHDHATPIAAHAADPAAHHARYTDGEADVRAALQDHDHATPIASHAADASAHHAKYTDAEAVTAVGPHFSGDAVDLASGVEAATRMIEADGAGGMVFVDKPSGGSYTDADAVAAMGVKADSNPLNHDRYTDAEADARAVLQDHDHATPIAAHAGDAGAHHSRYTDAEADARAALQDHDHASPIASHAAIAAAHHAKYLDSEAVSAMGALGDSNPLNHDRFALADIPHDPFFNGTFIEAFDATVASDGVTVTMSLEQAGGGDLTMRFSDGETVLDCTPADTIVLTPGTDQVTQQQWIYILQSGKVLAKSLTAWPTVEHIKVAIIGVPTAGFAQTNGCYLLQNINSESADGTGQGHQTHIERRVRAEGASYFSGLDGAGVDDYLTIVGTTVDLKIAAGVGLQMHPHTIPAFDTSAGDVVLVKNWFGDAYHDITNLYDIVADSAGVTIPNNRWFNVVGWAVLNKTSQYAPTILNLPSGTYVTQAAAEADVDVTTDYTVPREYAIDSSTSLLMFRATVQKQVATWAYGSTLDLRGLSPSVAASGSGAGGLSSPLTTKGDLWGYDTADNRLPVGTDDQVLTADAAEASGMKWATPSGGSGIVTAQMFLSSDQTLSSSVDDKIDFDSEKFDTDGDLVNLGSSQFVAQADGYYLVIGHWPWGATSVGGASRLAVYVNGSEAAIPMTRDGGSVSFGNFGSKAITGILHLSTSDTVELYANTGGTSSVVARGGTSAHTRATFTIARLI